MIWHAEKRIKDEEEEKREWKRKKKKKPIFMQCIPGKSAASLAYKPLILLSPTYLFRFLERKHQTEKAKQNKGNYLPVMSGVFRVLDLPKYEVLQYELRYYLGWRGW